MPVAVRIVPVAAEHLPRMAATVARRVSALRRDVPAVPATFTDPATLAAALGGPVSRGHGVVALDGDRMVGHLCWHEFEGMRRTTRRAVHIPEYGCAIDPATEHDWRVRDQLFRVAAERWDATGRQVVAVTELVGEPTADEFWIENGFGRFLHDGVRPCTPLDATVPGGFVIRPAVLDDLDRLVQLDLEHCRHYGEPPVCMVPPTPATADELAPLLAVDRQQPVLWVAADHNGPQAFLRAEQGADSCSSFLVADGTVAVTGVFTRPAARGRGVAAALFDAALRHHAARGIPRFAFDYETINPAARAFWPRHLTIVARSSMRVLERA